MNQQYTDAYLNGAREITSQDAVTVPLVSGQVNIQLHANYCDLPLCHFAVLVAPDTHHLARKLRRQVMTVVNRMVHVRQKVRLINNKLLRRWQRSLLACFYPANRVSNSRGFMPGPAQLTCR